MAHCITTIQYGLLSVNTKSSGQTLALYIRIYILSVGSGRCSTPSSRGPSSSRLRDPKTFTEQVWSIVDSLVRHILNCDRRWEQFCAVMIRPGSDGTPRQYIRMNPDLSFPVPHLDDLDCLSTLRMEVRDIMQRNKEWLSDVAYRLVASTFFFEKDNVFIREGENQFTCKGTCWKLEG